MTSDTINDLTVRLDCLAFVHDPSTGWYDHGSTRVVIDDADGGEVSVYQFTNDTARLLVWKASFTHAPADIVIATIRAALGPNHWSNTRSSGYRFEHPRWRGQHLRGTSSTVRPIAEILPGTRATPCAAGSHL